MFSGLSQTNISHGEKNTNTDSPPTPTPLTPTVSILSPMTMHGSCGALERCLKQDFHISCSKEAEFSEEAPSMTNMIPYMDWKTSKSIQFRPCSPILLFGRKTFHNQVGTDIKLGKYIEFDIDVSTTQNLTD